MQTFGNAVILCGGKSRRMGFDKSLLKLANQPVVAATARKLDQLFDTVRLSAYEPTDKFNAFGRQVLYDTYTGHLGPLVAIHSALAHATSQYVFVIAVDMPCVNVAHVLAMQAPIQKHPWEAVIPRHQGFTESLYGYYSREALPVIEKCIDKGVYKVQRALDQLDTLYLPEAESVRFDPTLGMFTNLNRPEDLLKVTTYQDEEIQPYGSSTNKAH